MPIAKKKETPQDFLNQMKSNLSKSTDSSVEEISQINTFEVKTNASDELKNSPVLNKTEPSSEISRKDKYADVMNVRLSKGRRNEIKAFCTNNGVTITQYIEASFEFFSKEVAAGNIVISKGGITKVGQPQ